MFYPDYAISHALHCNVYSELPTFLVKSRYQIHCQKVPLFMHKNKVEHDVATIEVEAVSLLCELVAAKVMGP